MNRALLSLYSGKICEVMFESYPQLITNIIIMVSLKRYDEAISVTSAIVSFISLLHGIANYINHKIKETDSLILPLFFCSLDIIFRTFVNSYGFLSKLNFWIFLLPLFYALIFIPLSMKMLKFSFKHAFLGTCQSFVGLYAEKKHDKFGIFFLSKTIFNSLALVFFVTALLLNHFNTLDIIYPCRNNLCYLPNTFYILNSVTIGILLVLSTLEGILSYNFSWMPLNRFYANFNPKFKNHEERDSHDMETVSNGLSED